MKLKVLFLLNCESSKYIAKLFSLSIFTLLSQCLHNPLIHLSLDDAFYIKKSRVTLYFCPLKALANRASPSDVISFHLAPHLDHH